MKRLLDIVASAAGLVVLGVPMLLVAMWVRLDSPGPALYRQIRVGRGSRTFEILKFRTMSVASEEGPSLTVGADSRVTRAGRPLRKYKVDELPQLLNVLRGDMSLVGPRPEVPEYANVLPEQAEVWSVRPGITDPASVIFRDESSLLGKQDDPERYYVETILPVKTRLYLEYVRTRTFVGDLRLLFSTLYHLLGKPPENASLESILAGEDVDPGRDM